MIKKEVFKDYGFFDEELQVCEDYDMWVRITAKENVGYLTEPLVIKYGGHSDQLSKKYWGMDRFRIKSLEKNINSNWFSKDQNLERQSKLHTITVSDFLSPRGGSLLFPVCFFKALAQRYFLPMLISQ